MFYRQIPQARYIPISLDEVLVKGGALEGFSLLIEDPQRRGITQHLVAALEDGGDPGTLAARLPEQRRPEIDELETLLRELAEAGSILADCDHNGSEADWLAFMRYGAVPDLSGTAPLVLLGGATASVLAEAMAGYGQRVTVVADPDAWDGLPDHALRERPPGEAAEAGAAPTLPVATAPTRVVFCADPTRRAQLYRFNERAVAARAPFLHVSADGVEITVGPHVVPGRSACLWEFERLWARSSAGEPHYELLLESGVRGREELPAISRPALVAAAVPWLVELGLRGASSLTGRVKRARATDGTSSEHGVMRLPRCPVCMPLAPALRNLLY